MGLIRYLTQSDSDDLYNHPDMLCAVLMKGYMFSRRKPTSPFKRAWCELRGGSLFVYDGQNSVKPRAFYATRGGELEVLGLQADGRFLFQFVTMEKVDMGPGLQLNFAADLARVVTAFQVQTEGELNSWVHALQGSRKSRQDQTDDFRIAAVNGSVNELRNIITTGIDINARFTEGRTALYWATCNNREAAIRLLLKHKANPSLADVDGDTPLHLASALGLPHVVEILIAGGAEVNARMANGCTPLHRASDNARMTPTHMEVVRLLLAAEADADATSGDASQCLHLAAFHGHTELIKALCSHGVAAGARDRDGYTPLHLASFAGHAKAVRMLLERDANVNATDADGATSLHLAAAQGNTEAVRSLVQMFSAPLDPTDQYGETPLHWAADRGHAQVVRLLVTLGADLEAAASAGLVGWTALHWAAARGNVQATTVLLQLGARVETCDAEGKTARSLAEERGMGEVVQIFEQQVNTGLPPLAKELKSPNSKVSLQVRITEPASAAGARCHKSSTTAARSSQRMNSAERLNADV